MKLYAKTTSERATKGQGGKYLDIDITDENNNLLWAIQVRDERYKTIKIFNRINKRKTYKYDDIYPHEIKQKGKSQKNWCSHYDYLPYKEEDLLKECGYCKENKQKGKSQKGEKYTDPKMYMEGLM